jgi:hypothetical protein
MRPRLTRLGALAAGLSIAVAAGAMLRPSDEPDRSPKPITFERFVASDGGGTACTREAPCRTLEAAYAAADPGDDVRVAGGRYRHRQIQLTDLPAKPGPPVVFRVAEGEQVVVAGATGFESISGITLDGSAGRDGRGFVFTAAATTHIGIGYATGGTSVRRFTLRGARISGDRDHPEGQAIWLSACRDVVLQDIEIHDIWRGDGIHISQAPGDDACRGVLLDRIFMHDFDGVAGEDHQDAIQVRAGSDITLRRSHIADFRLPGSQGWFANPVGDLGVGGTGCVVEDSVLERIGTDAGGAAVNVAGCQLVIRRSRIVGRLTSCADGSPACSTTQEIYDSVLDVACGDIEELHDTVTAYERNVSAECS